MERRTRPQEANSAKGSDVLDHGSRCRIGHLGDWSDVLVHRSQLGQGSDVLVPRGTGLQQTVPLLQQHSKEWARGTVLSMRTISTRVRCRREHPEQRNNVLVHRNRWRTPRSKERRTRPRGTGAAENTTNNGATYSSTRAGCHREKLDQRSDVLVRRSRCRRGHLYHRARPYSVHRIKREIAENDQPASLLQQAERGRRALLSTHHIRRRRHFELLLNNTASRKQQAVEQF